MGTQKVNSQVKKRPQVVTDDEFDLRELITKYLYYWPVFLLFTVITMIGAYAFHLVSKPAYEIKATLLLQEEKASNDIKSSLQEMGLAGAQKKVENDREILQSRRLIEMVINDLKLWVTYKLEVNHLTENLYKDNCPIELTVLSRNPAAKAKQKITVTIESSSSFLLKTADPDNPEQEYSFLSPVSTTLGTWQLDAKANIKGFIGKTIIINVNDPKSVVDDYQQNLVVELKDKLESSAVDITLKDQIPQRGQDFVNYLITLYNKNEVLEKNRKTKSTLDFIDQRLDSLAIELNTAEKAVEEYRRTHGLTDVGLQSQSYIESAQANEGRLNEVNIQLKVINEIEAYINAPNINDRTVPATFNISDQNLVALVQSYTEQQRERARMLATTPEMNPAFEPINRQIAATRAAIRENINNIKSSLQVTRKELLTFSSKYRSSIESLPGEDRELAALKRIQASKESLYNVLLQKREETALSYASSLSSARLVDMAYVLPLKATKALIPFIAALILGLLIPAGIIYLRDTIKNQVTSRRTIEKLLPMPIAGEVEQAKLRSAIVIEDTSDRMNFTLLEQFRSLRTQLYYLHDNEGKGRVTLLGSSVAGEGKSFIASNLGVALATSGKKTIILELNIYRPVMCDIFNLPTSHPGMSHYLNWECLKEEVIQNSITYRNLDVITSGQFIPNFSELLDRKRIEILLDWLRLHYDHILIDTSPLQVIGDANIVSRLCDVTLYVVRKNFTSKKHLPFISNLYAEQQLPNMSIVFNGADSVKDNYKDYFPTR